MSGQPLISTERQILTAFLLSRSSLSDILSLSHFTSFFPPSKRSHPQIKLLYRHLQRQRTLQTDRVHSNIETELRLGLQQRKLLALEKKRKEVLEGAADLDVEVELFGPTLNAPIPPRHTLKTFLPVLESAVSVLHSEISRLEEECVVMQEEIESAIGDMSDLRYGKFATSGVDRMAIEQLRNLYETCERVLGKGAEEGRGRIGDEGGSGE